MAKKKQTEKSSDGALVTAAKAIGSAAGKVAAAVGMGTPPKPKAARPVKKSKSSVPRKRKKAAKKSRVKTK